MGIIDELASGVKNSLKWRAESAVIGGVDSGVRAVIKGLKNKCPKCGAAVKEESATFCPSCGTSLVAVCKNPNCGRQSPLGTKFCPSCGSKLSAAKTEENKSGGDQPADIK